VEVCNQENQILVTNETRHQTYFFYPFEKGVNCFFERRDAILKALVLMLSKNLNLFYKTNSPSLSSISNFQKKQFQGSNSNMISSTSNF
jgi:hypothetical protein